LEFNVIDDDKTVNAFACRGKIAVYTGIFPLPRREWLAVVMGHEVAHALANTE